MYERVNHQCGDGGGGKGGRKTSGPRAGDEAGGHNFKPLDLLNDDDDDDDNDGENTDSGAAEKTRIESYAADFPGFRCSIYEEERARDTTLSRARARSDCFIRTETREYVTTLALTEYGRCASSREPEREREGEKMFFPDDAGQEGKLPWSRNLSRAPLSQFYVVPVHECNICNLSV